MATVAVKNANVFDGERNLGIKTIVIEDGLITDKTEGEISIDGRGCTLLPGLIEAHAHLYDNLEYLERCARNGVTTMLDMGSRVPAVVDKLREVPGVASVFSTYSAAFAPGSVLWEAMGFPDSCEVKSVDDVTRYLDERIGWGADFIKPILENPEANNGVAFDPEVAQAYVNEAHKRGKIVIVHAVTLTEYTAAISYGADEVTHIPYEPLSQDLINEIVAKDITIVPTVVMMEGIAKRLKEITGQDIPINGCLYSLSELRKAGARVLVGTDSNMGDPTTLAEVVFGEAMHDELDFFVQAGYSPSEALSAATSQSAQFYGLHDRGTIEPGKRADLYLVKGVVPLKALYVMKGGLSARTITG